MQTSTEQVRSLRTPSRTTMTGAESVRRILVGTLGEIAFVHFLNQNNKRITGNDEMLEVWEDVYAADERIA